MDHAEPTQPPVEKAPPMTPPPAHPKDSGGARFPLSTSTPTGPIPVVRRRPVTGKSLSDHVLASGAEPPAYPDTALPDHEPAFPDAPPPPREPSTSTNAFPTPRRRSPRH